jgi:prepilin-type N-terminal cleavage/methylation domain-containing protein
VNPQSDKHAAGFTLVELMVSLALGLIVMTAVLSSYIFLARSFTRSLGVTSANQPSLEIQSRRTLTTFAQDVRMATGTTGTFDSTRVTLTLPTATATKNVYYYFNNTAAEVSVVLGSSAVTVPTYSLVRRDGSAGNVQTLHSSLLTLTISYYDDSGNPYTVLDNSVAGYSSFSGIKQISMAFTSQAGSAVNSTLTPVSAFATPRLILRNRPLLP